MAQTTCPECSGIGALARLINTGTAWMPFVYEDCKTCGGSGMVDNLPDDPQTERVDNDKPFTCNRCGKHFLECACTEPEQVQPPNELTQLRTRVAELERVVNCFLDAIAESEDFEHFSHVTQGQLHKSGGFALVPGRDKP